jgi:hypothetical protein
MRAAGSGLDTELITGRELHICRRKAIGQRLELTCRVDYVDNHLSYSSTPVPG